jgi:ATP-dependent DNA ligase
LKCCRYGRAAEIVLEASSARHRRFDAFEASPSTRFLAAGLAPRSHAGQSDAIVIVGYEPSVSMPGNLAALLLAARKDNDLVYVGSVGTGFNERNTRSLTAMMEQAAMEAEGAAVPYVDKRKVVWLQPTLIADRDWTDDRKLRHSSYKGLAEPQDNASIFQFEP